MPDLKARELTAEEISEVWPLARTTSHNCSPLGWERQARRIASHGGGVVGVTAEDGLFHGIATYEPVQRLRDGRVLQVATIASFELTRNAPVRRALLDELQRVASRLGCEAVAICGAKVTAGCAGAGPG
jgi:hypothetical protein